MRQTGRVTAQRDPLADLATLEGVPSAVTAARDAADSIMRDRGQRAVPAETSAQALLAGARDSAALALAEVDEPEEIREAVTAGSIRLSTQLIDLAAEIRTQPAKVLARSHTLAAKALADAGRINVTDLGQVRPEARARIAGVGNVLSEPTDAPAQVVAAVVHAEICSTEPFDLVSGIIGRAVEHMVLIQGGIDPRAVLVPESAHALAGTAYRQALADYGTGTIDGVRAWLIHCCEALTHGAEKSPLPKAKRFRDDDL